MRVNFLSAGLFVLCLTLICSSVFSQSYTPKYVVGPGEYNCFILNSATHQLYEAAGGNAPHLVAGAPANVAYCASSLHHFGVIDNSGNCYVWGDNQYGEIGNGVTGATLGTPQLISTDINGNAFKNIVQIVPGASTYGYNTAALKADGTVWVWGNTRGGLIGNGTGGGNTTRPSQVTFPAGTVIKKIMFDVIGIALDASGNVWTWGGDMGYQNDILGQGTTTPSTNTPKKISLPSAAKEISGGGLWSYALLANGELYGWSIYPSYLGIGTSGFLAEIAPSTSPILLNADLNFPAPIAHIYTSPVSSYVLLTDSTIWAWGDNAMGTIGNGVELNFAKYATNPAPYGATAAPYAWDWGYGELLQQKPVQIAQGLHSFTNIFTDRGDAFYAYAEDVHGNLYSWGRNKVGVLGNGIYEADYTNGNIASQYPNSWDVAGVTAVNPFAITKMHLTSSPYCVTNPSGYPCNVYTIPSTPAPTVSAGTNQNITTTSTTVTGVASGNGGAVINYYAWTQVSGPSTSLITLPTGANATVSNLVTGTYVLQLKVTDNNWRTSTSKVTIVVNTSGAKPPVANAGSNISIGLPLISVATLNGSASSDPNTGGSITAYQWSVISGPTTYLLTTATTATPLFTALGAGTYVVQLKVTDKAGLTATSTVTVTVTGLLAVAPVANAGSDVSIQLPTSSTSLSASASTDPNVGGKISTYLWTIVSGPAGSTLTNATTSTLSLSGLVAGVYTLKLTVTDNLGLSSSSTVTVTVKAAPPKPLTVSSGSSVSIQLPVNSTSLNGSGTDPNTGGTITGYQWTVISGPANYTLTNATTSKATLSNLVVGVYVVKLTVSDNLGLSASDTSTVTVISAPGKAEVLVAYAGGDITMTLPKNGTVLNGTASSGPITKYVWTFLSGPAKYTLADVTMAAASLTNLEVGVYKVGLTVYDSAGNHVSDTAIVTVNPAASTPPVVSKTLVANAGPDISLKLPENSTMLNGTGSSGAIAKYHWTFVSGPSKYKLYDTTNAAAGLSNLTVGSYTVKLTVTDSTGKTASDEVVVTVTGASLIANAGGNVLVILPKSTASLNADSSVGQISEYSWSLISGPSQGAIEDSNSQVATLTNLEVGTYKVKLTVTDSVGDQSSDTVSVAVTISIASPTAVISNTDTSLTLSDTVFVLDGSQSIAPVGGQITAYSWKEVSGPSTALFQSPTGSTTGVTNLQPGAYLFQLTVTGNNGAQNTATIAIIVKVLSATSVKIFPNPVYNDLNVSLPAAVSGKVTMDIYDEMGHHLLSNTVEKVGQVPSVEHMDVSSLSRGAYFLKVSTQGERVTVKMIKIQ